MIKYSNVLIDGANISHLSKYVDYNILDNCIKLLEKLNYKPKIIIYERHGINIL